MSQASSYYATNGVLWPRIFRLLGDLEAAAGHRKEAIDAYRVFLDMWKNADSENQPTVQRVERALKTLGG